MAKRPTQYDNVNVLGNLNVGGTQIVNGLLTDDTTVTEDKKVQFRDDGIYLQSSEDGKLTIAADGGGADDITLSGGVTLDSLLTASAGFTLFSVARTATADGTGTGTIASGPMLQFVAVTAGGDANSIIILPAPTPGTIAVLHVGATGYELRSSDPATIAINGGSGAAAESAIAANSTVIAICVSATAWKAFQLAADGTLTAVEAAA